MEIPIQWISNGVGLIVGFCLYGLLRRFVFLPFDRWLARKVKAIVQHDKSADAPPVREEQT